jgi:hypothetical protein
MRLGAILFCVAVVVANPLHAQAQAGSDTAPKITVSGDAIVYAAPMSHGCGIYAIPHLMAGARHVVPASGGVDEVGHPHRHQVAMGEHHSLRPAGGAARVEEPGDVVGLGVERRRVAGRGRRCEQVRGLGGLGVDLAFEPG